ncbi:MAG: carotenoid oxygenase family protein [Polyangiales bacterium]
MHSDSRTAVIQVIGAIDWRLDGYLSGVGVMPGLAHELGLWSLRLRHGRAVCFWHAATRGALTSSDLSPLIVSGGRPWLSGALASALAARWQLPEPSGAVLCAKDDAVFMAVPSTEDSDVCLHRFAADTHASWRIARPSVGQLVQLIAFGDHVGLVDLPDPPGAQPVESRLLLCELADVPRPACTVRLAALCHPGIVNAHVSRARCVFDIVLADPAAQAEHGLLWRCDLDTRTGVWSRRLLAPNNVVDATVHPGFTGRAQRFAFLSCVDVKKATAGLYRVDSVGADSEWCSLPFGQYPRGLAVVGMSRGDLELTSWLATMLHDRANDSSKIMIAPARALARHHCVSIRMPSGMILGRSLLWTARPPSAGHEVYR